MGDKASVLIIYTGGTIGMVEDPVTGSLVPFDFRALSQHIPELGHFVFQYNVEFESYAFETPIDSSNMKPAIWVQIAKKIEEYYDRCDGFVVLHGSDTMAYSASALSFMLENLNKPVIFTGSQLPISSIRTDAKHNLLTSIQLASSREVIIPEVGIYFESTLLRGNRTRKKNAEDFKAFESDNYAPLVNAGVNLKYAKHRFMPITDKKMIVHEKLDTNIAILKIFPGITEKAVSAILHIEDLRGIVIETFGAGNALTEKWFINALDDAIHRGIVILNIAQCEGGTVEQGKYETSSDMNRIGVTSGNDMTTEAAVTKLMHLLGQDLTSDQVKIKLGRSLRGELTEPA